MDDSSFRDLLDAFDLSWEGYRKVRKGVKKRISRHLNKLSCPDIPGYLDVLKTNPAEKSRCELLLTVTISRFFRDKHLWNAIEKEILPYLFKNKIDKVKVWSACCANGEEAYSFKIAWDLSAEQFENIPDLEILATDLNQACIKRAKAGTYTKSSLKELPADYVNRFFNISGPHFVVKHWLKDGIVWKIKHIGIDPPDSSFHIIFLRNNILTYYKDHIKNRIFNTIYARLIPSGYLIIGSHEKLPYVPEGLIQFSDFSYIFKRV